MPWTREQRLAAYHRNRGMICAARRAHYRTDVSFREKRIRETRLYKEQHRDEVLERNRLRYHKNRTTIRAKAKEAYYNNPRPFIEATMRAKLKLKIEVMSHYCNGTPTCQCCGINIIQLLTMDHINNDGGKDRKGSLYWRLKRLGFPPGFRVMCYNCNLGRSFRKDRRCPHEVAREKTALQEK